MTGTSRRRRTGSNGDCTRRRLVNNGDGIRRHTGRNVDHLTNLHESVIGHILSRLPTKEAVRTSVLSQSWEYKWMNLYNVDVDDRYELRRSPTTFIDFMNTMCSLRGKQRSFRLTCWNFVDSRFLEKWISIVLGRQDIECFEVNLSASIVYPYDLLNSTSLRRLSLRQQMGTLFVAAMSCAPNLTSLNISLVQVVNGDPNSSTLALNFPVLETFTAVATEWLELKSVQIHAPLLTEFTSKPINEGRDYHYSIVIVAHRITKFSCFYGLPENIILNGSSIVSATLNSDSASQDPQLLKTVGSRAINLVNNFANLEELELSRFMVKVFQSGPSLQHHHKLTRLRFLRSVRMEQLFDFLRSTPTLKFLTIYAFELDAYNYEKMTFLPPCIVSHLEEVVLRDFDCQAPAYNLARFLLKSTNYLKRFIIVGNYHCRKEIQDLLSTFNKSSIRLVVEVRRAY